MYETEATVQRLSYCLILVDDLISFCHYRIQRRDNRAQKYEIHNMGCWWSAKAETSVETLLLEHSRYDQLIPDETNHGKERELYNYWTSQKQYQSF